MAVTDLPVELEKQMEETGVPDLLIGVAGSPDVEALRAKSASLSGLPAKTVIAYASGEQVELAGAMQNGIQLATYPLPQPATSMAFWADTLAAYRSVLNLASAWRARALFLIHSDLGALDTGILRSFTDPVLDGACDLIMPLYAEGRYDGLINKGLLAPLSRSLYGRRVRSPLPFDFCIGAAAIPALVKNKEDNGHYEPHLLWPSNAVAIKGGQIGQAVAGIHHAPQTDGMELSDVLAQLAGSLFQQAESCASEWQRVRGSQPAPRFGDPLGNNNHESMEQIDARPMVESFVLGSRNLEEVWRLVLPPSTMLELKRLARLEVEQFRMPDAVWARIVYDFALAYRMRRVSRTHVLGALAPLYLGWVASYTQEVGSVTVQEADRRLEQLARAFEDQKPYFVSRWRWPERVN